MQTIGAAFGAKKVFVEGETVTMGIWVMIQLYRQNSLIVFDIQDTAGSERYESMSRIYYRGAKAAIVCYGEYINATATMQCIT